MVGATITDENLEETKNDINSEKFASQKRKETIKLMTDYVENDNPTLF